MDKSALTEPQLEAQLVVLAIPDLQPFVVPSKVEKMIATDCIMPASQAWQLVWFAFDLFVFRPKRKPLVAEVPIKHAAITITSV